MAEIQREQALEPGGTQERGIASMVVGPTFQTMMRQSLPALGISAERLTRVVLTEFRKIPQLAACTPASFYRSVMTCGELGLVPGASQGLCWILPFRNRGAYEATFVLGYPGAAALAWRSGKIDALTARTVYEGEELDIVYGTDEFIHHVPAQDYDPEREVKGFYATMRVHGAERSMFHYMSLDEVLGFRSQYVRSTGGPWHAAPTSNEFRWMAQKTCFKQVCKLGPRSEELQGAFNADDQGQQGRPPEVDITDEANLLMQMTAEGEQVNAGGGFGAQPVSGGDSPEETTQEPKMPHAEARESEPKCGSPIDGGCVRAAGHKGECMNPEGATERFD